MGTGDVQLWLCGRRGVAGGSGMCRQGSLLVRGDRVDNLGKVVISERGGSRQVGGGADEVSRSRRGRARSVGAGFHTGQLPDVLL